MSDHVHEFRLVFNALDHSANDLHEAHCTYPLCEKTLSTREINRRLDATEQLSAEDVRDFMGKKRMKVKHVQSLYDYASVLEGK